MNVTYAQWMRLMREAKGKTYTELSQEVPMNRMMVWAIEKGHVVPIGELAERIHAYFGEKGPRGVMLEGLNNA